MKSTSRYAFTLLVMAAAASCSARTSSPSVPSPTGSTPSAGADTGTISERAVRAHMEFLASDALNGRGSGTRDEWLTATYIGAQFRLWGLEPMGDDGGFVQRVELAGAEASSAPVLTIGTASFTHGKQMLVSALGNANVRGPLTRFSPAAPTKPGAVVIVPDGVAPNQVSGAALVIAPETPPVRAAWAARAARMPSQPMRPAKLSSSSPRPTVIYLDKSAYEAVQEIAEGAEATFAAEIKAVAGATWNAVGRLAGSDPAASAEVIVLSAHLDHVGARPGPAGTDTIFNGADDDASGTVAVMTLADALARGPRPRRTLVFALFGSEETGGFGAAYFVDLPVVPLTQLVADLQFEMLGRPDPMLPADTLWLTGFERSTLGPELAKQGAKLVADPRPDQSFFTRSDNIRFARRGIVAHTVSSYGMHKEYHGPDDEIALIDFAHMTRAINSLVAPIRSLANSAFRPEWNPGGCPAPCK